MTESKTKCTACGAEILVATAERTGGLCMPCKEGRPRPVILSPGEAEAELKTAAGALETRASLLRVPAQRIPEEEWGTLAAHLKEVVPHWYRDILSRFALYGLALESRAPKDGSLRLFSFAGPDDFNATLDLDTDYLKLLTHGIVPLGYESDGNLWVMESPFTAASAVHMLDLSAWDGGKPAEGRGLLFAASRLALLLSSMAVSELSYQDSPAGVTSLLWHMDCELPKH
jgi:hypothetical protein